MADQTIGELQAVAVGDLPLAPDIYDDTLIPVEQGGEARHITGEQWKAYATAAAQGINKGEDGITPHIGENGNWFIGDVDTGVSAAGINGSTPYIGENGNWFIGDTDTEVKAAGQDGDNGLTPYIGDNGNWWFGESDTGVAASGQDGVTPHIGGNGHWYIGENDTGVTAQGPAGSGTGDMLASVYDPQGKAQDIFAYVDNLVGDINEILDTVNGEVV